MVFKIPESRANLKRNRFEFELGGEILSLPKMDYAPAEADEYLKSTANRTLPLGVHVHGFIEACDPEVGEKVRNARLARDQVEALYDAWREASKVTEGESSDSSKP